MPNWNGSGRRLIEMGHDAADARAIWMATQINSKVIAVKTEAQQDVLALHRMRQQLVKFRTMQLTSFVLPTEYGEVMARSRIALDKAVLGVLQRLSERLPAVLIDTLCEQRRGLEDLDKQITEIERRLHAWMK